MKIKAAAIAGILALIAGLTPVVAQQFPTVPDHTVIGRIGVVGQSGPSQAIPIATLAANIPGKVLTPQDPSFGAKCDGVTNDAVALQLWANALRDGGNGSIPSTLGCATSATITFMPSTNTAPVQGPHIIGNFKLIGHASLPLGSDLLRVWNPTAVTTSQNFYFAEFDSLELSNTTGTGNCLSLRGFWGRIGQVFARTCGGDGIQFPNVLFGGIPDEYESNPTIGEVTCIDCLGYVVNNQIGIGATPRFTNIRGTVSGALTNGLGSLNASGSEQINGNITYTGGGWGVQVQLLGAGGRPHEVFMQGAGDIDCAQNGVKIQEVEFGIITGHRLNVEPPGTCNAASWPLTAYSFGKSGGSAGLLATTVNAYVTIRPGVTAGNIGTLFDFNNDAQINGLTVNVQFLDQTGIIGTTMLFANIYKNINASAAIRIIQNGIVVYDTIPNVLTVPHGGTGQASFNPNQLVAAGSSSQVALVNVAAGTTTTVLHGNAAGLPTFSGVANADLAADVFSTAHTWTAAQTIQSNSATAFTVGANGATNPAFRIDASAASSVTGLRISSNGTGLGVGFTATDSGTNTGMAFDAKGSGGIFFGATSTGDINFGTAGGTTIAQTAFNTPIYRVVGGATKMMISGTAPTVNSGFCTTPSISNNNGTAAFTITIGSACAAATGVLTMPAASVGWKCNFSNVTNSATSKPDQTASTTTTVSVTNFVRTTGVAGNWTAADVIASDCTAY